MKRAVILALAITSLLIGSSVFAKSITWDANVESDLASGSFALGADIMTNPGQVHIVPFEDLGITEIGTGHEFYVTAYDLSGNESDPSAVINDLKPNPPSCVRMIE